MQSIEDALQKMVSSGEYAFTNFDNNKDFTTFDVSLSTEEKTKNLLPPQIIEAAVFVR